MVLGWCDTARSLLGAAALCIGAVGCATQHGDSLRLGEELGRARAEAAWQGARAAELESRVARLERRVTEDAHTRSTTDDRVLSRLDQLLAVNQRVLAERSAEPASEAPPAVPAAAKASGVKSAAPLSGSTASTPSPEQQLRSLVEGLRGRPGRLRGPLTREQEDALRVLLRNERKLDEEIPWTASFY